MSDQAEKNVQIQRVYVKDVSFEIPNTPGIFKEKWEPKVDMNLNTEPKKIADDVYEVVLSVTVTVKVGETTAYLCEVQQTGIFAITGFSDQEIGPMLGIYCPTQLFPSAREVVSDLVNKGSFPQFLLPPVNFEAVYAQHVQQLQEQQGKKPS
jgi:preprotein translocase subunit SecB